MSIYMSIEPSNPQLDSLSYPRDTGHYIVSGTKSFRLGCRKFFKRNGGNRQNLEKSIRKYWKADPGYRIVKRDQKGAEALVVAYLCEKGKYRSLFDHGIKPHIYVGLVVFAEEWIKRGFNKEDIQTAIAAEIKSLKTLPFWSSLSKMIQDSDEWKSDERFYYIAKKICHASNYGMMGNTFRMSVLEESGGTIVLSKAQADEYLRRYHMLFPEIREWHLRVQFEIKKYRMIRNLFNYPFIYTGAHIGDSMWKEVYSIAPQSTVACITHKGIISTYDHIVKEKRNWHLLSNEHDSFGCECPENEVPDLVRVMGRSLAITMKSPVDGVEFTMSSDAQVGMNNGPYKEKSNPEGLQQYKE